MACFRNTCYALHKAQGVQQQNKTWTRVFDWGLDIHQAAVFAYEHVPITILQQYTYQKEAQILRYQCADIFKL